MIRRHSIGPSFDDWSRTYAAALSSTMGFDAAAKPSTLSTTARVGAGGGAGAGDTAVVSTPATHEYRGAASTLRPGNTGAPSRPRGRSHTDRRVAVGHRLVAVAQPVLNRRSGRVVEPVRVVLPPGLDL